MHEITASNGATNRMTHLVYSHHHADHGDAAFVFDRDTSEYLPGSNRQRKEDL